MNEFSLYVFTKDLAREAGKLPDVLGSYEAFRRGESMTVDACKNLIGDGCIIAQELKAYAFDLIANYIRKLYDFSEYQYRTSEELGFIDGIVSVTQVAEYAAKKNARETAERLAKWNAKAPDNEEA